MIIKKIYSLFSGMEVVMKGEEGLRQYDRRELDFSDVFGGPPRPMREAEEKPVFEGRRRHLQRDDFFDDIFRGDESYSCSPWGWGAHRHCFSFPAKLTKVVDFPTFSSRIDHVDYKSDKSTSMRFSKEATLSCEDSTKLEKDLQKIGNSSSNRYEFVADNVKGDFANKQTDLRPKSYVKMQSQSCRWTPAGINHNENYEVNEILRKVEAEQCPQAKTPSYTNTSNDACSSKNTAFLSESDSHKILGENWDDPFEVFFELQELHDDVEPACEDSEADAKIREWSAGKERNIRSLLSTLQHVLWAGSEWKPIALVDLVEENPVKRAYQKALLRLHPDKLQQKSASLHHKYIAHKVFDILQEAWDHFNNTAPIVQPL